MSGSSRFTVLRTLGPTATKRFSRDPLTDEVIKTAYGKARHFSARSVRLEGIYDLSAKLLKLEGDPRAFIVRGEIAGDADTSRMRRLLYPDGDDRPTLVRCARRWMMVDFDNVPCPDGLSPATDPEAAVSYLLSLLPPEFSEATCHWQFGSSQGFKTGLLSAHLWFWLDREVEDGDLTRWAKHHRASGIDPAVFRPAQAHYTSAPVFDGVADPLPRRSGLRRGTIDEVSLALPEGQPTGPRVATGRLKPAVGFEGFLARIGSEDGFHEPILSAIGAYVRQHRADGTDVGALVDVLRQAVLEADPGGRDEKDIERYASEEFLRSKISWTIAQDQSNALTEDGWKVDLICGTDQRGNRKIRNVVANAILVLRHDDPWRDVLGFDEFAQRIVVRKRPPFVQSALAFEPREWRDEDDIETAAWLQTTFGLLVNSEIARQAALTVARDNSFHPVREYLGALRWDGKARAETMLARYFGVKETTYTRAVSVCWLISAVARIFRPGCKADHVLTVEGPQGIGKSSGLRALAGQWFTDELDTIGSKDAATQLQGAWFVELAELDAMSRAEVSRVKAFMSKTFDRFRPPYGKHAVRYERQCIFAGTVNHSDYLRDETGNRRFWPVKCAPVTKDGKIDVEGLARDRDQLWAEAVVRYQRGERWWLESAELVALATSEQDARFATDAWEPHIARFVRLRDWVTVGEVLEDLGVEQPKQGQPEQNRVARCLKRLGWQRRQRTTDGIRVWGYGPAAPVEAYAPLDTDESGDAEPPSPAASSPPAPLTPLPSNKREQKVGRVVEEVGVVEERFPRKVEGGWCTGESGASGAGPADYPCVVCKIEVGPDTLMCDPCLAERLALRSRKVAPVASCPACRGTNIWMSPHGVAVCRRCHPPASEELVS